MLKHAPATIAAASGVALLLAFLAVLQQTPDLAGRLGYSTAHRSLRDDERLALETAESPEVKVETAAPVVRKTFVVDQHGFPVSGDEFFDKCFRASYGKNTLTIADIRNNVPAQADVYAGSLTRKSKAQPRDCASFHPGDANIWHIPGDVVSFSFNPKNKRYTLPAGYILKRETIVEAGADDNNAT